MSRAFGKSGYFSYFGFYSVRLSLNRLFFTTGISPCYPDLPFSTPNTTTVALPRSWQLFLIKKMPTHLAVARLRSELSTHLRRAGHILMWMIFGSAGTKAAEAPQPQTMFQNSTSPILVPAQVVVAKGSAVPMREAMQEPPMCFGEEISTRVLPRVLFDGTNHAKSGATSLDVI